MKKLSKFIALLLAMMMLTSTVASAITTGDLTESLLNAMLRAQSDEQEVILEQVNVIGWPVNFAVTDGEQLAEKGYTFQWYQIVDAESHKLLQGETSYTLDTTFPVEEEQYYCEYYDPDGNRYLSGIFVISSQTTELADYINTLTTYWQENVQWDESDNPILDTYIDKAYETMTKTWNVTLADGSNLAENVLEFWWNGLETEGYYTDLLCSCVISGNVTNTSTCVLPRHAAHHEDCLWYSEVPIIIPNIPQPDPINPELFEQYTSNEEYDLPMAGDRAIILPEGGRAVIKSNKAAGYQWQVYDGTQWVSIQGETGADLVVTTAKLATIFDLTSIAEIRYFDAANDIVVASVSVVSQEIAGGEYVDPVEEEVAPALYLIERAETDTYTLTVNFWYAGTQTPVYESYVGTYKQNDTVNATVTFPVVVGYQANWPTDVDANGNPTKYTTSYTFTDYQLTQNETYVVYYWPADVGFEVRHYWQNVNDDGYTLHETEKKSGLTNAPVLGGQDGSGNDLLAKEYAGFYQLPYSVDGLVVAADGSTYVEIYYDRYYRLINFDLGGGYGVDPIYDRYGMPVDSVADPERAGYVFRGWSLDGTNRVALPTTIPATNQTYIALWAAGETSYTVVYWSADLDDGNDATAPKYSYMAQQTVASEAGVVLTPSQVGAAYPATDVIDEAKYFSYAADVTAAKNENDKAITVAGDGSTVVNVYYSRNSYTIRFIYTRQNGTAYRLSSSTGCGTYNNTHADNTNHTHAQIYWNYNPNAVPVVNYQYADNTGSFVDGDYTYHYIYLTAEYGANIEERWPAAPLPKTGNYDFGSWAAQCGSPYREKYGAEHSNIVGAYPIMSEDLIMDPANPIAQTMVAWWGRSGSNGDNVDTHNYHIYFEALPGQENIPGARTLKDGVTYVPVYDIDSTCAHNGNTRVDPFEYAGYTCVNDNKNLQSNSENFAWNEDCRYAQAGNTCPYCNVFYYKRNTYTLSFFNHNNDSAKPENQTLMFGESFANCQVGEPTYPSGLEANAYKFGGWYTTPECYDGTEVNWNSTMPAGNVTLYAKWEPVTHTVNFYLTDADYPNNIYTPQKTDEFGLPMLYDPATFQVPHGDYIIQEYVKANLDYSAMVKDKPNSPYVFVYWKYLDAETGEWKAFDPTTPVRRNMDLIGVWSSDVLVDYKVYFQDKETGTEIAAPITGQALAGVTKTFDAKGGTALYDLSTQGGTNYQTGYFPVVPSHSITMDVDATQNEFTFKYIKKDAVPYKVYYLAETLKDGENPANYTKYPVDGKDYYIIADPKPVDNNTKSYVTENYLPITGYLPDAYQKSLAVSVKEDGTPNTDENVIYFFYEVNENSINYQVIHYIEDPNGDYVNDDPDVPAGKKWSVYVEQTKPGTSGQAVTESPLAIPNYTYQEEYSHYTDTPVAGKELTLELYYTENTVDLAYIPVGPDGKLWDGGTAYVTGTADTTKDTAETVKVITGSPSGATAVPKDETYRFIGWYSDAACKQPVPATWVTNNVIKPTKTTEQVWQKGTTYYAKFDWNMGALKIAKTGLQAGESAIFKVTATPVGATQAQDYYIVLSGNSGCDSVTITNLAANSDYTVTEQSNWSWSYTLNTDQTQSGQITAGSTVVEEFSNAKVNKWLHDENGVINDFKNGMKDVDNN